MATKTLQDIFIKILSSELNGTELDCFVKSELTHEVVSELYTFSKRHDLAHIVSSSLSKNGLPESEMSAKFKKEEIMAIYRNEQMKYAYNEICEIFETAKIPYIPLKGAVIRPFYPSEEMRTSCDIDILVKEENLNVAVNALQDKGYRCDEKEYHDISLYSPNNIHLELHFNLCENIKNLDAVLKNAWDYAQPKKGFEYEFSNEFFLFYIMSHISYHFVSGGCGVRSLMDIWVIEHKMGIAFQSAKDLLEKTGIYQFAEKISALCEICFSGEEKDDLSEEILAYIFKHGVYGTQKSSIAAKKVQKKSTLSYLAERLFLPYNQMTVLFPALKKAPILLPFCWIIRFFRKLFGGKGGDMMSEIRIVNNISDNEIDQIKQLKNKMGL